MTSILLATVAARSMDAQAEASTPPLPVRGAYLSATDGLGRTLPTYAQVGPSRPNRWIGLFYSQWHGDDRWGPDYDVTQFLKSHPGFKDFSAHPPGGPDFPSWYWAQPLFGYYRSTDPWVVRKHLTMLADAGVDFLFLDYTHDAVYDAELKTLLTIAHALKSRGVSIPRFVFFLNKDSDRKAEWLYTKWYKTGLYDDLWFRWRGKPLLMAPFPRSGAAFNDPGELAAVQGAFTWRPTQALFDRAEQPTTWRFVDNLQSDGKPRAALGPSGLPEQIAVDKSVGGPVGDNMTLGGVSTELGRAPHYNDQWLSGDQARGLFFQRSWNAALANPAPILLVTGWNEWKASVRETPGVVMLGRKTAEGQGHLTDAFNMDFNRDLEPMRGGYGDAYYWQFVANVRRYKGMVPPRPFSLPRSIRVDGPLTQWDKVRPTYPDAHGDVAKRDWPGAPPNVHYRDDSARNDLVRAQVTCDRRSFYFRVRTANKLTKPEGTSWMLLLIDTDGNPNTGWNGYDLLVGRDRDEEGCSIEHNVGNAWNWREIGQAASSESERDLVLSVPRGTMPGVRTFGFKWADNLPERPDVMDFYTQGDVLPNARFEAFYTIPTSPRKK